MGRRKAEGSRGGLTAEAPKPLIEAQLADFERQADEVVRQLAENPHNLPGPEAELKSSLALMVKRLVAEVRRLRQLAPDVDRG